MKRNYEKPMISFEEFSMDMPVAVGCSQEGVEIGQTLLGMNYFAEGKCIREISDDGTLQMVSGNDKLCYYTLSSMLFTS